MMSPAPLPQSVWDTLPVEVRALIEAMRLQIDTLQAEVHSLKAQLNSNSHNSSKPPSTDPIHLKRQPPRPPSVKKRGGQPGHRRAIRPLVPPDRLHQTITCKPPGCAGCGAALDGSDPVPLRHQVAEVPPIRPEVVEYQVHRLVCSGCGVTTRGALPEGGPRGSFGPRLHAMLSLLAGEFRLAKRQVQHLARTLFGLDISLGMVAKLERQTATVLGPVDAALAEAVPAAPHSHIDETPWREANGKAWLWVGTGEGVTHYRISRHRDAETAGQMLGDDPAKVVICDRFSAYGWVSRKQWCWAHLRRDFQAMIDRDDGGSAVGSRLLKLSDNLFWGWHRVAQGELSWDRFLGWAGPIREGVRHELSRGVSCPSPKTAATCRQLLGGEEHLWRFLAGDGVDPTNNRAERALRHGVLWRKSSGGTASEWGSRFVSRLLGVVATCRQQGRGVLDFLTACFEATIRGQATPSLCTSPRLTDP
jgi:transposase